MKKATQQLKKAAGFTLVELIVVLVILSILAALLVPALTGYIENAKRKEAIAQCRACAVAASVIYAEKYGRAPSSTTDLTVDNDGAAVLALAELSGEPAKVLPNGGFEFTEGCLTHLYYYSGYCYVTYCSNPAQCAKHADTYTVSDSIVSAAYDSTSQLLTTLYESTNKTSTYDSIKISDPTSKVYQLWIALSPAQQAFLENTTWRLDQNYSDFNTGGLFSDYPDTGPGANNSKGWRLRVADQKADGKNVNYTVYALGIGNDGKVHVYKQNYTGATISGGKITVVGHSVTSGLPYCGWSLVE